MSTHGTQQGSVPPTERRRAWKRRLIWGTLGSLLLFGLIQLVPFGHGKNPPVTKAATWPNAQAASLASSGCNDCHSNLTKRWWATEIAPASWLAQSDVNGGRNALNFSEWDKPQADLDNVIQSVQSGSMPPLQYKLFHANARLSDAERTQLVDGLRQLYATDPPAGTKEGEGD